MLSGNEQSYPRSELIIVNVDETKALVEGWWTHLEKKMYPGIKITMPAGD